MIWFLLVSCDVVPVVVLVVFLCIVLVVNATFPSVMAMTDNFERIGCEDCLDRWYCCVLPCLWNPDP